MILVESTATAKIKIKGTDIILNSVTTRLQFNAPPNGTQLQVAQSPYASVLAYDAGSEVISIDGFDCNAKTYSLAKGTVPETYDPQSNLVAHQKTKEYLESLGFTATIIGL